MRWLIDEAEPEVGVNINKGFLEADQKNKWPFLPEVKKAINILVHIIFITWFK